MGKRVWVVGTDIGGTDVIGVNLETKRAAYRKGRLDAADIFDGVINGLARAGLHGEKPFRFVARPYRPSRILERKVKTALISPRFRDVLGGGRAERISAFGSIGIRRS
jgi:hypothetical protein